MKLQAWKRLALVFAIALLLMTLSGCELFFTPEGVWLAEEFFDEWMDENDLNPAKPDGSLDPAGAANLGKRALTDSTGDEESDAALDFGWIDDIAEADKMMDEARRDRDPNKMAEAIRKRPNDYSYRASAAVLAAELGDEEDWASQLETGDELTEPNSRDRDGYAYTLISESANTIARLDAEGELYTDPARCEMLYNTSAEAYELLYYAHGNPSDLDISRRDRDRAKFDCHKTP